MSLDFDTLCHPDGVKSCGACCGCYNHSKFDSAETLSRLATRTDRFRRLPDFSDETLRTFRLENENHNEKLVPDVPNCPFLGLIDRDSLTDSESRVGCLVHPTQLGRDGRDCGVYDQQTCEEFLCASHSVLSRREQVCVILAVRTSYLYGLVITDPTFVRAVFRAVSEAIRRPIPNWAFDAPELIEAWGRVFALKETWPFGASDSVLGYVQVVDGEIIHRNSDPSRKSAVRSVVECLGTSIENLKAGDRLVQQIIETTAECIVGSQRWT